MKKAVSLALALGIASGSLFTSTAFAASAAKCDTAHNFSIAPGTTYQFCVTASSKPSFGIGNSKVFNLVKSSKSGTQYYYTIKAVGSTNDCAGIYVNGVRECVVSVAAPTLKCDTTGSFSMLQGAAYQFCVTASSKPSIGIGNSNILSLVKSSQNGNQYFYTVKAVGNANDCAGIYINGVCQCVVSIKAATVANGVAGNDAVANAQWLASNLGFYLGVEGGAYYNPDNNKVASALITVGYDGENDTVFQFRAWDGDSNTPGSYTIRSKAQQLFKFYFPYNYMKLYNMIEAWDNGSNANISNVNTMRTYNIDGRNVRFYFYDDSGTLQIIVGNK